jgi:hypothetical protein
MAEVVTRKMIEKRRRGFFGWIFLSLFWLSNAFMAAWLVATLSSWGSLPKAVSQAEKTGAGLGMAMGLGMIFSIWACVAAVTGLFALMTRGRKEITEIEITR